MKILYIGTKALFDRETDGDYGMEIISRQNSLQANEWLSQGNKSDAIICEFGIPGLNGLDYLQMLRTQKMTDNQSLLVLVHDKPDKELMVKAMKAGIHDVFTRPLDESSIATRLGYLISHPVDTAVISEQSSQSQNTYRMPFIKRAFDIVSSGIGLILLSPVFLIIALLIKLESKGPVFYTSKRVGTGYKVFDFFKFRSMFTGADLQLRSLAHQNQYASQSDPDDHGILDSCPDCARKGGYCSAPLHLDGEVICENQYKRLRAEKKKATFVKILNDPRVTRVGRFIRKTSIDELPQLFNVLIGDMSVVGNRPLPLYEAEELTSDMWGERFLGPAGITGLWQVSKRGKKDMSDEERKQLDNQYARHYSFLGDIKIILRTIPALLQKEDV